MSFVSTSPPDSAVIVISFEVVTADGSEPDRFTVILSKRVCLSSVTTQKISWDRKSVQALSL